MEHSQTPSTGTVLFLLKEVSLQVKQVVFEEQFKQVGGHTVHA